MCGICGFVSSRKIEESELKRMNDSIAYRGPDDSGEMLYADCHGRNIGIAHRRLSIMDLSKNGHQPMLSDDGNIILTFNGEIYNFKEIRVELEKKGYSFQTKCDTEVILKAYQCYGINCLQKLNGMFAVVIYDKIAETIILARDRIGVKPLYYYYKDEDFVWGSELKPITLFPNFCKEIRTDVLGRFFCHKFIKSPDTIFEHTYKVEPGQYIIYKNGDISAHTYWNILEKYEYGKKNQYSDYCEAKTETSSLIEDAVKRRMIADVPVGIFLSGGIDSTVIAAFAQKQSSNPIKTYTIGFETQEENEAVYAKEVANVLGTNHTETYISDKELVELLKDLPIYFDEPFSDSSQLPTMLVSQLAKKDVSVVLSGDGGDELYCGYEMYDWVRMAQKLDGIGDVMFKVPGIKQFLNRMPDKPYAFINNRDIHYKAQLFTDVRARYVDKLLIHKQMNPKYDFEQIIEDDNWQVKRMLIDMKSYLPDEVLCKTDRCTMKYSLEGRNPLVDYRLVEDSFRIPHEYKYHDGTKKYILKDIAYGYIDKSLLDRPKKGFGVPLNLWLRKYLADDIRMFLDKEKVAKQGIFDYEVLMKINEMTFVSQKSAYSTIMWSYYVFQRWYQYYVEDLWK